MSEHPFAGLVERLKLWTELDETHMGEMVRILGIENWAAHIIGPHSINGARVGLYRLQTDEDAIWCPLASDLDVLAVTQAVDVNSGADQRVNLLKIGRVGG